MVDFSFTQTAGLIQSFIVMTTRILLFVLFLFSYNIYPQGTTPKKPTLDQKAQDVQTKDELSRHLDAAETFQISGDLDNAAVENRAILGIALQRMGDVAIEEGKFDDAVNMLLDAIGFADNAVNRTSLAVAYQRLNRLDQAVAEAQNALAIDPKYIGAHYVLGNVYFTKGDYKSALPEFETIFRTAPDFDIAQALGLTYLYLRQPERAKLLFEEIQISAGKESPDLHLVFAQAYQKAVYPAEAEREIRRALAIDPKHPKGNFFLGYLLLQESNGERLAEAGAAFDEELKLTPDDFFCNFFAGVVASAENQHEKAIKYLQKAIKIDPRQGGAYLFLGQSQIETNDLIGAEKSLRQAVALEGGKPEREYQSRRTHFLLGRLLVKTGRKDEGEKELNLSNELQEKSIQSSRDQINQILGKVVGDAPLNPGKNGNSTASIVEVTSERTAELTKTREYLSNILAQAYDNLGVIAVQKGRTTDALDNFASASKWKKDFPGLDRNWGIVSFRAALFDKAIGPLTRQLKAAPNDVLIRKMLGLSYYFTKDAANAVLTLKPIEKSPDLDPELAYFYGISLIQLKRNAEAAIVYGRVAENSQTNADALLYSAQGFMMLGDYARAVKELQIVASLDARKAKVNYYLGQSLIRLNRYDEAEKAFTRELELNPIDAESKYLLAMTLIERKIEPEKTIAILQEAIGLKYDYADARYQLGKIFLEKGEINRSIEQLEIAASSDAEKDYIHYQLSIAYRKASRKADADRELARYQELKAASRKSDSPM